jgi:hypothetical protein
MRRKPRPSPTGSPSRLLRRARPVKAGDDRHPGEAFSTFASVRRSTHRALTHLVFRVCTLPVTHVLSTCGCRLELSLAERDVPSSVGSSASPPPSSGDDEVEQRNNTTSISAMVATRSSTSTAPTCAERASQPALLAARGQFPPGIARDLHCGNPVEAAVGNAGPPTSSTPAGRGRRLRAPACASHCMSAACPRR